ncbi:MAG: PQQ-binding-like beta-propeller repeat protein [Bryobacteraceae bacterium]
MRRSFAKPFSPWGLPQFPRLLGDWPQFLGPLRNGSCPAGDVLKNAKLLWKKDSGSGFSGPVVSGGKLILFHRLGNKEVVECWAARTGEKVWSFGYPATYRDDFGHDEGPRATPAIVDSRVYTFGAAGALHALDLNTGRVLWQVDTHAKFEVRKGFFGAAASPLVDERAVYLNVGGKDAGLVAFDKTNGNVLWKAGSDEAGYSSPILVTLDGKRTVLCFTRGGLLGVDPANGSVRFQHPWRSRSQASVNAALPVVVGNLVFLSASYNTGATVLQVGGGTLTKLWSSDEALSNHYATSVYKDGQLYGFHGRQEEGQSLRCVELKTGKVRWSVDGFGAGSVTLLGDQILVVRENGEALLAPATPAAFAPTSKVQLLPGVVRSYPALADGILFVRNETALAAYSLAPQTASAILERASSDFQAGRIAESVTGFDAVAKLDSNALPHLWQRGIALYYAGRFEECRRQFELHRSVNPNDVENAAWHFLCVARASGVERARQSLLPAGPDNRVPMREIYRMFRGELTPTQVITVAGTASSAQFYAHLYAGLYLEALGRKTEGMLHVQTASDARYKGAGYMHDVARVHLKMNR